MATGSAEAWLAIDSEAAAELIMSAQAAGVPKSKRGALALLDPPRLETLASAMDHFSRVAWTNARECWLPLDELFDVLGANDRRDLMVAGMADPVADTLTVYRGDLSHLTVSLTIFQPTGEGIQINPSAVAAIDHGHAVRLGDFEAATDAILYECDRDYRARLSRIRRRDEKTFGASLRRLRVLRGLRQSDFLPLPAKTIARIEQGQVERPQGRTLKLIAERLRVTPSDIQSY
jgi:hypothetical protein